MHLTRRRTVGLLTAATGLAASSSWAEDGTIKIGVVVPLAGAFAASGQDVLHGAELAAKEINDAGGIRALGGRKLELVSADAGQSPETTVTAARRVLNAQPVAAMGCWYSALTLAATQVAEQRKTPWLTGSAADALVRRGFQYTYQISAGSEDSARGVIETIRTMGTGNDRLALMADNNAVNVEITDFLKKNVPVPIVANPTWAPPLADATPVVAAVLRAEPTFIYLGATSTTDQILLLKQLAAQGNKALIIMGASSAANPAFLGAVGQEAMENLLVVTPIAFPGKGAEAVDRRFASMSKEPFMDCEGLTGYVNVNIIALALERAGKAEAAAVQAALKAMDESNVPAAALLPGGTRLRFGANGRREGALVEVVQWQGGRPLVVTPAAVANGQLKRKG